MVKAYIPGSVKVMSGDATGNCIVRSRLEQMRDFADRHGVAVNRVYFDHRGLLCIHQEVSDE